MTGPASPRSESRQPESPQPERTQCRQGEEDGGPALPEIVSALHAVVELVERVRTQRLRGIGFLVGLNVLDVATTVWFLALGGSEGNLVLAPIVHRWWLVVLVKVVVLALLSRQILEAPARSRQARLLVNLSLGYYLSVVLWNLVVVNRLLR